MTNLQEGIVLQNEGEFARVNALAHSSCDSCGACSSPKMTILAYNPVNAAPGQKVLYSLSSGNMLKIAFILFFLPLLSIFTGAAIGYYTAIALHINATLLSIVSGSLLFILSIINIVWYDRKYKLNPSNFAKIIEVISERGENAQNQEGRGSSAG